MPTFSLVINAGGQSRRMGQDKALLPVPKSGQPLLRHIVDRLRALPIDRVIIVANKPAWVQYLPSDIPALYVPDAYPGAGPLGGLATGVQACLDWGIYLACDLPLVNPHVLQFLCELAGEPLKAGGARWDAIVPRIGGYEQPLHALYQRSVAPAITKCLAAGERRATSFLPHVRVRWVSEAELRPLDPDLASFFNVNTPAEWAEAVRLLDLGL